jgi:hypothetical protein
MDDPAGNFGMGVADHYAFRTEQRGVASLGVIGQKVDVGEVTTCDIAIWPL